MCGIAGIHHFGEPTRPIDAALLDAMTDSLAHRGPDGRGTWMAPGVGLGHRRLAILDLSSAGAQPMGRKQGTGNREQGTAGRKQAAHTTAHDHVVVFNGEIYNFRELRRALEAEGYAFGSSSDTEVILAGYERWGVDVVEHIEGIFAFAIWDATRRRLLLARDPIGVKPLFYSIIDGTLRFGSEIKAILTDRAVPRDPDDKALDAFLTFNYTPAPATGFRHVRQLLPGHVAIVENGQFRTRRFWQTPYGESARQVSFEDARREFTELLDAVTKAQMVSDVPVGAFLSGGLDSAAIVRAMTRAGAGEVHALTVGFDAAGFDERDGARASAAALGVALAEQELRMDAASLLPRLARHVEEPTADSSMLPVYLLCKAARERFTVAMSGDGADELLAGYETYRATALAERYRRVPGVLRKGVIAPLAGLLPAGDGKYGLHQVATRFVRGAEEGADRDHCAWRVIFHDGLKQRVYQPDFLRRVAGCDPLGAYAAHVRAVPASRERLAGLLNADTEFYLPNDMLVKVDRMSMANSLEVRVPFLDVNLVRFCADLPAAFKLQRGKRRKHILRESLRGSIPDDVLDRRKSGFNIPLERWMRESLRELMLDAVQSRRHELGRYLDVNAVEALADEHAARRADHAHALFGVMMLALWFDNASRAWREAPERRPELAIAGA